MARRRVVLADGQPQTIERWRGVVEPEFEVVGSATTGQQLLEAVDTLSPDVIVSDVVMPGLSGMAAAEMILHEHPAARVVFVTLYADRSMLRRGLAAGAYGYVLKVRVGEDLVPAIRAALRDELLISPFPPAREQRGERDQGRPHRH